MNRFKRILIVAAMSIMALGANAYPWLSPYAYCMNNPVKFVDPDGKDVWIFSTKLPYEGFGDNLLTPATHTFIVVRNSENKVVRYAAYGPEHGYPIGGDRLAEMHYSQDVHVYEDFFDDIENSALKEAQKVRVPNGMTSEEFDKAVINTINNFGNVDGISYTLLGGGTDNTEGNCNSSSSTILIKSGVKEKEMQRLENNMSGFTTGFRTKNPKAWTKDEQLKALEYKEIQEKIEPLQKP